MKLSHCLLLTLAINQAASLVYEYEQIQRITLLTQKTPR